MSASVEELDPSGRVTIVACPETLALDGEPATISISEWNQEGVVIDSFHMTVTPRVP